VVADVAAPADDGALHDVRVRPDVRLLADPVGFNEGEGMREE
jgi:hypothetical protein